MVTVNYRALLQHYYGPYFCIYSSYNTLKCYVGHHSSLSRAANGQICIKTGGGVIGIFHLRLNQYTGDYAYTYTGFLLSYAA
jgi:hypothetical protein